MFFSSPRTMSQQRATSGSSIWMGWKRRVSAGSFSMCWRYSDQVVAAIVRSVPRARAGLSRLAASPVPAAPPAPISVWASSMNRMTGCGEACTSSITERKRCSNSPFIAAPACISPMSSAHSRTSAKRRRHVAGGDALGKALHDGRLADARLAGEDRVVLAPPHEHVDDLADLVVAPHDGVHAAFARLFGEVGGEPVERRRALGAGRGFGPRRAGPAQARPVHRAQIFLVRAAPDAPVLDGQGIDVDRLELLRQPRQHPAQLEVLQHGHEHMAGADLGLAEKQRRVVPAAVERVDDVSEMPGISVLFMPKPAMAPSRSAESLARSSL
jgi:hypothetical protein